MNRNRAAVAETVPEVPPSAARLLALVADKLAATEKVFERHLASDVPFIQMSGEYLLDGGGKRMRPALLLLSARLLGRDSDEEVTYGAVVELIHTGSLIHDDIIDNAALRRGQDTINRRWGNSLTVLLGDWLYTTSMKMALAHDNLEVIGRLCEATLSMTEGELLSLERLSKTDVTAEEYFEIIDRKTAQLFSAACFLPSLMRPARPREGAILARYGRSLGTCFQLVDDLLDFTGRQSELGKPVLSDLKEGKLTLPLILLLSRVGSAEKAKIQTVLDDGGFGRVGSDDILELVTSHGTVDEVRELAERHAVEAREALEPLPECDAREALELATEFVLRRRS